MRLHLALLLSLSVSSLAGIASAADDGIAPLEKPTTQVFNNKRDFNQEQVVYKNKFWRCSRYRSDGSCVSVEEVPEDEVTLFDESKKASKTSKRGNYKIENPDDTPCACVFNNKRMWNPEKIIWNDQYWRCVHYRDDGTCSGVEVIPPKELELMKQAEEAKKAKELASQDKPIPAVFHKKNRMWTPEKVRFKEKEWQCASYSDDGLCLAVEEVVEQPDPLEFGGVTFAGLDRLYSCEAFGDKQLRNKLTLAEFNRFLALAKERKMWNDTDIKAIQTGEILVGMSSCGAVSLMGYAKNGGGYINDEGEQEGWAEYEYRSAMIMVDYHNHIITNFQVLGEMQ
ncbi:hypothetical protein [Ferrimonas sp. YFM]|uniref:hypothetical protein n=1 Tax=Ferrimonas sp. YFM TaxID=3028878 RepID=UPI002574116F|nr:hypothetical protein [Ferrimonas sp. YFM]BDY04487.1 hypothetical protein F0521_15280 [Ferrimonas sp. YFM]